MSAELRKVGELARETGLTVRTLHHYDHIGLVRPSGRSSGGHRLYVGSDVERLYQVLALRQIGLPLADIAALLARDASAGAVLEAHAAYLADQLESLGRVRRLVDALIAAGPGPDTSDYLEMIRSVVMVDETVKQYFDEEQLATLASRRQQDDGEQVARVERTWRELLPRVGAAAEQGMDPASAEAQALARQWADLLAEFHEGDEGLREGLFALQAENADRIERDHGGPTAQQLEFIRQADAAARD